MENKIENESENKSENKFPNPSKLDSEVLCSIVATYRSLGMYKDFARECMIELSNRQSKGSDYDFIKVINEKINQIPVSQNPQSKFATTPFFNTMMGIFNDEVKKANKK